MCSRESPQLQLGRIRAECQPGNFCDLYALAASFCEAATCCVESIETEAAHYALTGADYCGLFNDMYSVRNLLKASISESFSRELLQETQKTGKLRKVDLEAISLSQNLHTPSLRGEFLSLLVASSVAFIGRYLTTVGDPAAILLGWSYFVQEVRSRPAFGRLAAKLPCMAIQKVSSDLYESQVAEKRQAGFEYIDLCGPMYLTETEAWAAWMQAGNERGQDKIVLLEECVAKLTKIANFVLFVDTAPWSVKQFVNLTDETSMTKIARGLCRRKLVPLSNMDLRTLPGLRIDPITTYEHCLFTTGTLRRKKYVVRLPPHDYLSDKSYFSTAVERNADPIQFMRRNWHLIPHSLHARQVQSELEMMRQTLLEAKLERGLTDLLVELTPEAFALALVESSGLPHVTALFLSPLFRRVFSLIYKR